MLEELPKAKHDRSAAVLVGDGWTYSSAQETGAHDTECSCAELDESEQETDRNVNTGISRLPTRGGFRD